MELGAPLSDLYAMALRVADRSVAVDAAVEAARSTEVRDIDEATLGVVARLCHDLLDDNPDHAHYFSRLVLELAEARWARERESPWWTVADLFVEVTRLGLESVPRLDRMLLALGVTSRQSHISRRTLARLKRRGGRFSRHGRIAIADEKEALAATLQAAGWLVAGPYCVVLDPEDMEGSYLQWVWPYRLCGFAALDAADGQPVDWPSDGRLLSSPVAGMPGARDMLPMAMGYLNRSLRTGPDDLRTQVQIKRARVAALRAAAEPERAAEHWRVAEAAADEISDADVPLHERWHFLEALAPVWRHRGRAPRRRLRTDLEGPARGLRDGGSADVSLGLLSVLSALVQPGDLPELWDEVHAAYAAPDRLSLHPGFWGRLAHRTVENALRCPAEALAYGELIPAVEAECDRQGLPPRARAATLAHAALHVRDDDLDRVIRLLCRIDQYDRGFADTYAAMLEWVVLTRRVRYAKHRAAQGDYDTAMPQYLAAMEPATRFAARHGWAPLCTTLADQSLEALLRSGTAGQVGMRTGALFEIAELVMTSVIGALDERAAFVRGFGQLLMRSLLALIPPDGMGDARTARAFSALVAQHHLLFKGVDFWVLAQSAGPRPTLPYAELLHREITERERACGPYVPDRSGVLDDLLTVPGGSSGFCFVSGAERTPEHRARPSIGADRRAADHLITESLLADTRTAEDLRPVRPGARQVNQFFEGGVGEDTVVISLYLAEDHTRPLGPEGDATLLICCQITAEEQTVRGVPLVDLPGSHLTVADPARGSAFSIHWAAVPVAQVRDAVNADPLGHPVTLHAEELLGRLYAALGGPPRALLRRWQAAGKRHLCFWPHGPLHFAPFHLLHDDGRPLADAWTVTTVSSSAQLAPRPAPGAPGRRRVLIAGSPTGGVRYGLPEQPGVAEHVRRLGDRLAAAGTLDVRLREGATPRAVMAAAEESEYLHIAAHGSQDVEAPWYQCVFLEPEEDGEGRLFAHQILTLDLRGVELVTLSACESALGRYDANDNHRGLPAAFLLAGAATVIGALWPVTATAATLFFEELYSHLGQGHPKRDAFRHAQQRTRWACPEYRDWGAFTFIGHWR
ncbi:CHAT domain-containing protein [Streptomyces spectabilis]|uniref:CHAT domain-containing protein n=1 Tax=Streptomyces spectabilis TaxID=68270 RepID=A0A516RGW9_STRST|nr:CHAT domain-containing protein [Streptomyces spectabilis]QDQ14895.1 CHAT domain-containing protein [Streptomyces spectabilis]